MSSTVPSRRNPISDARDAAVAVLSVLDTRRLPIIPGDQDVLRVADQLRALADAADALQRAYLDDIEASIGDCPFRAEDVPSLRDHFADFIEPEIEAAAEAARNYARDFGSAA